MTDTVPHVEKGEQQGDMRLSRERNTIRTMIQMYCRKHHNSHQLCPDCKELLLYAEERINSCRFGGTKPVCSDCPVHCYKPSMQEKVRKVMRYAGPRMIVAHPILAIRHYADKLHGPKK